MEVGEGGLLPVCWHPIRPLSVCLHTKTLYSCPITPETLKLNAKTGGGGLCPSEPPKLFWGRKGRGEEERGGERGERGGGKDTGERRKGEGGKRRREREEERGDGKGGACLRFIDYRFVNSQFVDYFALQLVIASYKHFKAKMLKHKGVKCGLVHIIMVGSMHSMQASSRAQTHKTHTQVIHHRTTTERHK